MSADATPLPDLHAAAAAPGGPLHGGHAPSLLPAFDKACARSVHLHEPDDPMLALGVRPTHEVEPLA